MIIEKSLNCASVPANMCVRMCVCVCVSKADLSARLTGWICASRLAAGCCPVCRSLFSSPAACISASGFAFDTRAWNSNYTQSHTHTYAHSRTHTHSHPFRGKNLTAQHLFCGMLPIVWLTVRRCCCRETCYWSTCTSHHLHQPSLTCLIWVPNWAKSCRKTRWHVCSGAKPSGAAATGPCRSRISIKAFSNFQPWLGQSLSIWQHSENKHNWPRQMPKNLNCWNWFVPDWRLKPW